jgi:hypothetical protein
MQVIPLDEVVRALGVKKREALLPDTLADAARAVGHQVLVLPFPDWESRSDEELVQRAGPLDAELLVITEASFDAGAFVVRAEDAKQFLIEHQQKHEPVFNGDLILLGEHKIICVHHERFLFLIER